MSKARQEKRSKIKPFIKVINYNHLMPTRYTLELEGLKNTVSNDTFKEVSQREDAKKNVKKVLEERYTSGKNRWFFTPLSTFLPCQSPQPLPGVIWETSPDRGHTFDPRLTIVSRRILSIVFHHHSLGVGGMYRASNGY